MLWKRWCTLELMWLHLLRSFSGVSPAPHCLPLPRIQTRRQSALLLWHSPSPPPSSIFTITEPSVLRPARCISYFILWAEFDLFQSLSAYNILIPLLSTAASTSNSSLPSRADMTVFVFQPQCASLVLLDPVSCTSVTSTAEEQNKSIIF